MQGWRECEAVRLCRAAMAIMGLHLPPVIQSVWRQGAGRADARVHNSAQEESLCPLLHPQLPGRLPTVASPTSAPSPSSLASSWPQHSLEWIAKKADATSCHYSLRGSAFVGNWGGDRSSLCSVIISSLIKDSVVLSALRLQRDWS